MQPEKKGADDKAFPRSCGGSVFACTGKAMAIEPLPTG